MILDKDRSRCDGCGKDGSNQAIVRGGIGRTRLGGTQFADGLHQSFDYCVAVEECFCNAAIKALQDRKAFLQCRHQGVTGNE